MIHVIPGDPVRAALGPTAPPELVAAWREDLGLNLPLWEQYLNYLQGLFTGDLGTSIVTRVPVIEIIAQRLPATASLALLAFLAAVIVAVPIGVAVAVATHRGRRRGLELGFASGSVFASAIPDFLLGVALVYIFGVQLQWLPVAGREGPESYILPVIALMVGPAAVLARIVRVGGDGSRPAAVLEFEQGSRADLHEAQRRLNGMHWKDRTLGVYLPLS